MNKKKKLYLVMSNTPWDWSGDYTRQTCLQLSTRGRVFCFVRCNTLSIKEYFLAKERKPIIFFPKKNILVFTPLDWIPFKRFSLVSKMNYYLNLGFFHLLTYLDFRLINRGKIIWIFHPMFADVMSFIPFRNSKIVFDLVDNFVGEARGEQEEKFTKMQQKLTVKADVVVANSHYLYDQLKKFSKVVTLVPQGFDAKAFEGNCSMSKASKKKRPVLGYVGGINNRLDFELIKHLVVNHPEWEFWFYGPIQNLDNKNRLGNWEFLKKQGNFKTGLCSRKELGSIIDKFDVGLIPYSLMSDFERYCHPMKVLEYIYFGVPTVSSAIYELTFPEYKYFVEIAHSVEDWENMIDLYLRSRWDKSLKARQRKYALSQSWEIKVNTIINKIDAISR